MARKHRRRLNPLSYPKTVRDRVEIDYAQKLSPALRQWLAAFNEAEYGSNPSEMTFITEKYVRVVERRRLMREIKRYQRDMMSEGLRESFASVAKTLAQNPEDLLIHQIDHTRQIERAILELLKQSVLLRNWGKCGKA